MLTQALVVLQPNEKFLLQDIELDELHDDEVLVEMVATGICHTDLKSAGGGSIVKFPVVLGHEGAGVVKKIGTKVKRVAEGDKVLLSFNSCGQCRMCQQGAPAYCKHCLALNFGGTRLDGSHTAQINGKPLFANFFGQSSLSRHSVVNERSIVKVSSNASLETLAPLGCGLQTGAGAVVNVLKVPQGSSIAIFGIGAVGFAALMAAKTAKAGIIIAIDIHQSRLDLALELGATHTILSKDKNVSEEIRKIVDGGVEFAVDCTGVPRVIESMIDALGVRGKGVTIGSPGQGQKVSVNIFDHLVNGRSYIGTHQGDSNPAEFIPYLIREHEAGRFPFDKFVTHYKVEEIDKACADVHSGTAIKAVILWK